MPLRHPWVQALTSKVLKGKPWPGSWWQINRITFIDESNNHHRQPPTQPPTLRSLELACWVRDLGQIPSPLWAGFTCETGKVASEILCRNSSVNCKSSHKNKEFFVWGPTGVLNSGKGREGPDVWQSSWMIPIAVPLPSPIIGLCGLEVHTDWSMNTPVIICSLWVCIQASFLGETEGGSV